MASHLDRDPRKQAPESIKKTYKYYQKLSHEELETDPEIIDFERGLGDQQLPCMNVFSNFAWMLSEQSVPSTDDQVPRINRHIKVYEHTDMPGR